MESGPSPEGTTGYDRASHYLRLSTVAEDLTRVPPPFRPNSRGLPTGWKRGAAEPQSPESRMWSKRGHRGRSRAGRTRRGAEPERRQEVGGPRLGRLRVPTRLPAVRRAPPPATDPAATAGQSHSPYLVRLFCLL
jgi:hypothetical protein